MSTVRTPTPTATRSQEVRDGLVASARARQTVVLTGHTGDLLELADGRWAHLPEFVADCARGAGRVVVHLDSTHVEQVVDTDAAPVTLTLPQPNVDVLPALLEFTETLAGFTTESVTVLVEPPETAGPVHPMLLALVNRWAREAMLTDHRLVVVLPSGADPALLRRPAVREIRLSTPDREERSRLVQRIDGSARPETTTIADGTDPRDIVTAASGLPAVDIHRHFHRAEPVTTESLVAEKRRFFTTSGGLRLVEATTTLADVAGLPQVRLELAEWSNPTALLLYGPPGCGKTFVAAAMAHELGRPLVSLGEFRSAWVGQSELNLRAALDAIRSLGAALVLFDEVDLALGSRNSGPSADGGTNERLMAMLLSELGDRTGPTEVTWLFTTNSVAALDPATLDRMRVIPVLNPSGAEVVTIVELAARQRGILLAPGAAQLVAHRVSPFTSARTLDVLLSTTAARVRRRSGTGGVVTPEDMLEGIALVNPQETESQVELMALNAIRRTTSWDRLPWIAASILGKPADPPAWLTPYLDAGGRPVLDRMVARIAQLQAETSWR
ncbi:MAG: ATP-binding protein [Frankiales bacterium]|nr:ATP-binding protein [Frankiales bacterium]